MNKLLDPGQTCSFSDLFGAAPIAGIYKITHIPSGKVYIGQSQDILTRLFSHWQTLHRKAHTSKALQADFDKDGQDGFTIEIVERCVSDPGQLLYAESQWIINTDSRNPDKGYNTAIACTTPESAKLYSEREARRKSPETQKQMELFVSVIPTKCPYCSGLGVIGRQREMCPVCEGKKVIPKILSNYIQKAQFQENSSKLPATRLAIAKHDALAWLLERCPSPADLFKSEPKLFRCLQDTEVFADGTPANA